LAVTLTSIWTAWEDGREDELDNALHLVCLAVRDLDLHQVDGVLASPLNYFVRNYLDDDNPEDLTYLRDDGFDFGRGALTRRSIMLTLLDLFSGIGGFSLGFERTGGFKTVGFCENDPKAKIVLRSHWPGIPIHDDVTTLQFSDRQADAITAGFPCQDVSSANASWGDVAGLAGERSGLYREALRAVRMVRPRYLVLENVAALVNRGLGTILGDLAGLGYDAEWHCVRASDIGAPHERDRIWIIAYPVGSRRSRLVTSKDFGETGPWRLRREADLQSIVDAPFKRTDRWPQPLIRRMDDGIPGRVDRLHGVGNSIVPEIAEIIAEAILRAEASTPP
jgi:DNA (cytosine-5)-methyltransferase 1